MNRNYLHHTFSMLVILIAIVACVLPGQAVQPTPGVDLNAVATAVEGTAQAAAQQTAAAQPVATSLTGSTVEQLQDGTTQYTDYDAGLEITFPAGWLAVRPNLEEFNATLAKEGAVNPSLQDQMTLDQTHYEADFDRLYSYALRPDIKKNVLFGFAKLGWASAYNLSIDNVTMGQLVKSVESSSDIPGFRAETAQLHEDTPVKKIEIGGHWTMTNKQGETVPLYSTFIFFKPSSNSTARVTFTFLEDYHTQISADMKSISESIRLIEPQQ